MSSMQTALTIITTEISIILAVLLGAMALRYLRKYRNTASTLRKLAGKIQDKKEDRLSVLNNFLIKTCHFDEEKASQAAASLIEKERQFYSSLIDIYQTHDNKALLNLDNKTEDIINSYRNLLTISVKSISEEAEMDIETRTKNLAITIKKLDEKNKILTSELDNLKNEMDITVKEYSSAFLNKQSSEKIAENSPTSNISTDKKPDSKPSPPKEKAPEPEPEPAADNEPTNKDKAPADNAASDNTTAPAPAPQSDSAPKTTEKESSTATTNASTEEDISDDSVEPEFHSRGFSENDIANTEQATAPPEDALNDELEADLETLAAKLDVEREVKEANPGIPLDGLEDDDNVLNGDKQSNSG